MCQELSKSDSLWATDQSNMVDEEVFWFWGPLMFAGPFLYGVVLHGLAKGLGHVCWLVLVTGYAVSVTLYPIHYSGKIPL